MHCFALVYYQVSPFYLPVISVVLCVCAPVIKMPYKFVELFFVRLRAMGHTAPMNIFLKQEIDRIQVVIKLVRVTLRDLLLAIEGVIIMSEVISLLERY